MTKRRALDSYQHRDDPATVLTLKPLIARVIAERHRNAPADSVESRRGFYSAGSNGGNNSTQICSPTRTRDTTCGHIFERFTACSSNWGISSCLERKNVAIDKKRSRIRSGKDRRRGVDTRTEEEKKLN